MNPNEASTRETRAVDAVELAYVEWRAKCSDVWNAYTRWNSTTGADALLAHAVYAAALDREEAAAHSYAVRVQRLERLVALGASAD